MSEYPLGEINDINEDEHTIFSWFSLCIDLFCRAKTDIIDDCHLESTLLVDDITGVDHLHKAIVEGDVPEQVITADS